MQFQTRSVYAVFLIGNQPHLGAAKPSPGWHESFTRDQQRRRKNYGNRRRILAAWASLLILFTAPSALSAQILPHLASRQIPGKTITHKALAVVLPGVRLCQADPPHFRFRYHGDVGLLGPNVNSLVRGPKRIDHLRDRKHRDCDLRILSERVLPCR